MRYVRLAKYLAEKHILRQKHGIFNVYNNSFICDYYTAGISRALAIHGIREVDKIYLLEKSNLSGKSVLDLGSNIGFYTSILSSLVGPSGSVHCVEPDPRNYSLLLANIALLNSPAVKTTRNVALTTHTKSHYLDAHLKSNLSKIAENPSSSTISVQGLSFADYLTSIEHPRIDFVRMDIEGYEQHIIPQILGSCNPAILFEIHSGYNSEFIDFLSNLTTHTVPYVVSTQGGKQLLSDWYDLTPTGMVRSDRRNRYVYENISLSLLAQILSRTPRTLRYALLSPIN